MNRIATILLYIVGFVSVAYLALYAYAFFTRPRLRPGDPIRIFRKQDAPNYSEIVPAPIKLLQELESNFVMAGHRRSKNGVASLAYDPAIHVFSGRFATTVCHHEMESGWRFSLPLPAGERSARSAG